LTLTLIILLFLLGLLTGYYSGLLGTGGNIILIPAFDIIFAYFDIEGYMVVKYIIAHSLFITIFLGMSVSYKHFKIGNFHIKDILTIGIPGMATAYFISEIIKRSDWYDKFYFDLVFLILLLLLAARLLLIHPKESDLHTSQNKKRNILSFMGLGMLTGSLTSLSGLGGGVILIPFLTDVQKIPIRTASSISIGVITLLAMSVSLSYSIVDESQNIAGQLPFQVGYISFSIILPILLGIFIASSFGVKAAQKTSPKRLRIIFGVVVTILCFKMIYGFLMY